MVVCAQNFVPTSGLLGFFCAVSLTVSTPNFTQYLCATVPYLGSYNEAAFEAMHRDFRPASGPERL